jgi:hypothetical protein
MELLESLKRGNGWDDGEDDRRSIVSNFILLEAVKLAHRIIFSLESFQTRMPFQISGDRNCARIADHISGKSGVSHQNYFTNSNFSSLGIVAAT